MTASRLFSLSTHGAAEMMLGLLTMLAPFLFGFGPSGTVMAVAIGAVTVGLALAATDPSVAVAAHHAYDHALALTLLGAALVLGLAGDPAATAYLVVAAGAELVLILTTRYSAAR